MLVIDFPLPFGDTALAVPVGSARVLLPLKRMDLAPSSVEFRKQSPVMASGMISSSFVVPSSSSRYRHLVVTQLSKFLQV